MWTIQNNTNKNRSSKYQTKICQITNKNEMLTHFLYVDNSNLQQQKQIK